MRSKVLTIGIALVNLAGTPVEAAALKTSVLGCKLPTDLAKAMSAKAKRDAAALAALTASRACLQFAKGITIEVDESKSSQSCVRLTGDLDCYWVPDSVVDQFPSVNGAGSQSGGGHHRH